MEATHPINPCLKARRIAGNLASPSRRLLFPALGRWLSRDPIEEQGGLNLYGFGPNNPNSGFDVLGSYWRRIFSWYEVGDMYSPPLPLPPNVVVMIGEYGDLSVDRGMTSATLSSKISKEKNSWTILTVSDISDANDKLRNDTRSSCIDELNIMGHANSGYIWIAERPIGADSRSDRIGKAIEVISTKIGPDDPEFNILSEKTRKTARKIKVEGLKLFENVNFCKDCKIYLRGCSAGKGPNGRTLVDAIARKTGCKVYAWSKVISPPVLSNKLPANGDPDIESTPFNLNTLF